VLAHRKGEKNTRPSKDRAGESISIHMRSEGRHVARSGVKIFRDI